MIGKFASAYMPREYMDWKARAAELVRGVTVPPAAFLDRPVRVDMVVRPPKAKTSKLPFPTPDVDNYAKAVLDAMTDSGCWWSDDKQVLDLRVRKEWASPENGPGTEVTVTFL